MSQATDGVGKHYAYDGDLPVWAQIAAIFFSLVPLISFRVYAKLVIEKGGDGLSEGDHVLGHLKGETCKDPSGGRRITFRR